ncbi:hypothetical protein [Protaetiibacter intestinalis]|uniref:Uncharacterized protein n=1 Tax=Protaetiibacter intestinalis TaxID=2419774 RepID=A0A387B727_9MICO|nr:hypothetical protein [Protaetiibacter intestinalis]AYF96876.1 hypothetical protein D7I47_00485 [Protaetiibacter intestinalis]
MTPRTGYAAPDWQRRTLLGVTWFNLVTALIGGAALASGVMPALGLPLGLLDGSPFRDYLWPGIILMLVVGGTQLAPLVAYRMRLDAAWGLFAIAGFGMMTWIFIETGIIGGQSALQLGYFTTGLAQCVFVLLVLGVWPRPLLRRG